MVPAQAPTRLHPALRPDRTALARLVGRFRPVRGRTTALFLVLLLRSALDVAPPLLVAVLLDALVGRVGSGGALPPRYLLLLGLLAGVLLARMALFYVGQVGAVRLGQDLENRLRGDLFRHVMRLRFRYHDENRSGRTIARSLRDMEKARHFFREVWFGYLEIGLLLAAVLLAVFWTHWTYGVVVVGTFGPAIAGCVVAGRKIASLDRGVSDVYDGVATVLQENVAGARVVRAFGREREETHKFGGRMDHFSGGWARLERFWTGVMPPLNHLYHLCMPLAILVGTLRVAAGHGGVGEVAAVLLFVRIVHHRIRPLTRLVIVGQQAVASASRVFEVLDNRDVIERPRRTASLPARGGDLRLEEVHFGHEGPTPVLRGVSLHVPAGSTLGILGPTGSGKSSLVHLVPRFYDPDRGRVLLDGHDVRDLDVHALRAAVGLVFQEPFLFAGTVAENIAYGCPTADRERIEVCARLAAAHEFVRELPHGYETVIGERGISLSGGQRQRLTIARALLRDPRILIFDDATASVDAITEREIFEGIREAARGRTSLVISQRVTAVRWCDRIAVLDGGRVTALGRHRDLLAESALYREIHRHQQLTRGRP